MHGEIGVADGWGNKRYIRKDGLMCVTIVKAKDGTSAIDSDFRLERALLDEVSDAKSTNGTSAFGNHRRQ